MRLYINMACHYHVRSNGMYVVCSYCSDDDYDILGKEMKKVA